MTATVIRVGALMPLGGDNEVYGFNMKKGIEAALAGQTVQGRMLEFEAVNDFGEPITTLQAGNMLIEKGIFSMLGNVGTLTALKLMPVLTSNHVPAVGFYAAGEVGQTEEMLNFRPSHAQEIAELIRAATDAGVKPTRICAFLQNDAYGLAGIEGLKIGLSERPETQSIIDKLDHIIDMTMGGINPALDNLGPVGFYRRGTMHLREGYQSLKAWEQTTGEACRLVVLVAVPQVAAAFIAYARYKNEPWIFAALSVTAAGNELPRLLQENGTREPIIITQVVPAPDATLPLLTDARGALGPALNPLSLEGFIVGRMFLSILRSIDGPLTRTHFLQTARRRPFEVGGLKIDFTDGNPGSSSVLLMVSGADRSRMLTAEDWRSLLQN
ncbi:MAG: ABC transporter substrate-binding protein [Gammaproteobacteria bacterium]|nr:ABC transporter substrate-binding protein [Gammaproteobacteria bacterium]